MYKAKPHKGMSKRFRVTKTGKIKHRHEKNSHLRSGRSGKLKRHLGRPGVLAEGMARNVRRYLGKSKLKPLQVEHEDRLAEKNPEATTAAAAPQARPARKPQVPSRRDSQAARR